MFPSVCPSESALPRVFCMCRILLCNILISMFICPAEVLFLTSCLDCTDFKTIVQGDKAIINVLKEYTKNSCFFVEVYNSGTASNSLPSLALAIVPRSGTKLCLRSYSLLATFLRLVVSAACQSPSTGGHSRSMRAILATPF